MVDVKNTIMPAVAGLMAASLADASAKIGTIGGLVNVILDALTVTGFTLVPAVLLTLNFICVGSTPVLTDPFTTTSILPPAVNALPVNPA